MPGLFLYDPTYWSRCGRDVVAGLDLLLTYFRLTLEGLFLHAEVSFGTFSDDESALSGKGVHLRCYEAVQTSGVSVGSGDKAFSFVGNEVIGKGAEVAFPIDHLDGHVV